MLRRNNFFSATVEDALGCVSVFAEGGLVGNVTVLRPVEGLSLDPARLAALYSEFGAPDAEGVLNRAIGEMALVMSSLVRQYTSGDLGDFGRNLRSLRRVADHVGMTGLALAAQAVMHCLAARDATALAATWTRLLRVGQMSLASDWDQRGFSR